MPSSSSDPDPVVLIHGAWAGSWVWERIMPFLADAGLSAHAVDLPGNGTDSINPAHVKFEDYLDCLDKWTGNLTSPVSLVAHSGGGVSATAFAERWPDRVSRIVYIAGMMLPSDGSFVDLTKTVMQTHPEASGINPHTIWSSDRSVTYVPVEAAIVHFFNDCSEQDARAAASRLTPQGEGGRAVVVRTSAERFGRVPRLYVEALNDRSVILPAQRLMQTLVPGARVISLPTGHAPQFSAPRQLAEAIIPFLRAPAPMPRSSSGA